MMMMMIMMMMIDEFPSSWREVLTQQDTYITIQNTSRK